MCPSYPWLWCCWESPHPWKRGWSPAVGGAGGCDPGSSRTALMPGSWRLTQSSSPSPSPRVSDSTSCDYRGSGTWRGRRERILLEGGTDGWSREGRGGQTDGNTSLRGGGGQRVRSHHIVNQLDVARSVCVRATHLNTSCSITSSQYKPMRVRKSASDTVPNWRDTQTKLITTVEAFSLILLPLTDRNQQSCTANMAENEFE